MKRYNIVTIEITNEGEEPELKKFTVGGEDLCPQSKDEIAEMALASIGKVSGKKEVKYVADLSEEDYNTYLHNQLMNYIHSDD